MSKVMPGNASENEDKARLLLQKSKLKKCNKRFLAYIVHVRQMESNLHCLLEENKQLKKQLADKNSVKKMLFGNCSIM